MTLDELRVAYIQIAKLIANEIRIRNQNGDKYNTKLEQWEKAQSNLTTIKDELKRQIGEKEELKRELEQDTLFPMPSIQHVQHYQ